MARRIFYCKVNKTRIYYNNSFTLPSTVGRVSRLRVVRPALSRPRNKGYRHTNHNKNEISVRPATSERRTHFVSVGQTVSSSTAHHNQRPKCNRDLAPFQCYRYTHIREINKRQRVRHRWLNFTFTRARSRPRWKLVSPPHRARTLCFVKFSEQSFSEKVYDAACPKFKRPKIIYTFTECFNRDTFFTFVTTNYRPILRLMIKKYRHTFDEKSIVLNFPVVADISWRVTLFIYTFIYIVIIVKLFLDEWTLRKICLYRRSSKQTRQTAARQTSLNIVSDRTR